MQWQADGAEVQMQWKFSEVNPALGKGRAATVPVLQPSSSSSKPAGSTKAVQEAGPLGLVNMFEQERVRQKFIIETSSRIFNYAKQSDKRKMRKYDIEAMLVEADKLFKDDEGPLRFPVPLEFRKLYDKIKCTRTFPFGADLLPATVGSNFHLLSSHLSEVLDFYLEKTFNDRERLSKELPVIQLIVDFARHAEYFRSRMMKVSLIDPMDCNVYWCTSDALNYARWLVQDQFQDLSVQKSQNQYCRDDLSIRQAGMIPFALLEATRRLEGSDKCTLNVFSITYAVQEKEKNKFFISCKYDIHGKVHKLLTGRMGQPAGVVKEGPSADKKELMKLKAESANMRGRLFRLSKDFAALQKTYDELIQTDESQLKEINVTLREQVEALKSKVNTLSARLSHFEDVQNGCDARVAAAQKRAGQALEAEKAAKVELEAVKENSFRLTAENSRLSVECARAVEDKINVSTQYAAQIAVLTERAAQNANSVSQLSELNISLRMQLLQSQSGGLQDSSQVLKPPAILQPSHDLSSSSPFVIGSGWQSSHLSAFQPAVDRQFTASKSYECSVAQHLQPEAAAAGGGAFLRPWEDKEGCTVWGEPAPAKKKHKSYLEERPASRAAVEGAKPDQAGVHAGPKSFYLTHRDQ